MSALELSQADLDRLTPAEKASFVMEQRRIELDRERIVVEKERLAAAKRLNNYILVVLVFALVLVAVILRSFFVLVDSMGSMSADFKLIISSWRELAVQFVSDCRKFGLMLALQKYVGF
jgi:hypothetical protein